MKRKALADLGIMPVSGNEEPRVLSRQSSYSFSCLPIRKRWYSVLYPHAPIHPSRNVDDLVKPALAEKLAGKKALGTAKVSVKKEVVSKQGEIELPADSGHVERSLGPNKLHVSSLVDSNTKRSCLMRGTVNPPLLSSSLNNNDVDDIARTTNKFNWDLNIRINSWEGSGDAVPVQDTSQVGLFCKKSSSLDIKPPTSFASVIGSTGDKEKLVVGASEQEFNFPIASIHPSIRHKSANVLRVSLGGTLRGFDSSVLQLKSEPVEEAVCPGGTFEDNVGCVREDDIYEDGEIRELLMQSIAEDPMAEEMDSGQNKSYDDHVEGCDEKAEKILHKDINLQSPLLDKEETTGDDEQRPIGTGRSLSSRSGRERDEIYGYGPKFFRDRFQDRSFGSSRGNFMPRRWRSWGRRRYFGRDFESYGGVADYRFGHKRTTVVWKSANERNDYDSRLDGGAFASNRRRNPLNDAMQRSGFPQMWSKSPVRSRTWSLPPRRLTEGLNGRQDSSQHMSPVMYREDRMRSSSRTYFTEEAIAHQRRDPPSYTSRHLNDMRDVDHVQECGHSKSLSSRRSPPDQVFTRTYRLRVENLDHQERDDDVGYFDGRFPELHSCERRKYGKRQEGPRQMRNVTEQEGGNLRPRYGEKFDSSILKKRRF